MKNLMKSHIICSAFACLCFQFHNFTPQGPHSHILMMGGGGSLRDFFGSEILAKSDICVSIKDARIFLGHDFLGVAKKGLRDFFEYAKKK